MRLNVLSGSTLCFLLAAVFPASYAATGVAHNRTPLSQIYPDKPSVVVQMGRAEQSLVCGQNASGSFMKDEAVKTDHDITDSHWGSIALLTYWWAQTDGGNVSQTTGKCTRHSPQDNSAYTAVRRAMVYGLANREFHADPLDTSYLWKTGKNWSYGLYELDGLTQATGTNMDGNFADTAFTLIEKATIIKYGTGLFDAADLTTIGNQAREHWKWLKWASRYNPEQRANQVMAAITGAMMLGDALNDSTLKSEAKDYYDIGIAGTNNTTGYRNLERVQNPQGYWYFKEDYNTAIGTAPGSNGFDVHYSGYQLTLMAVMLNLLGNPTTGNLYNDAVAEAKYVNARLSATGTMHGGSRHNEITGSTSDIALGLGYNYFGHLLNYDMARVEQEGGDIDNNPSQMSLYGHRGMSMVLLHEYFQPWATAPVTVANDLTSPASFRKGTVSVHFEDDQLPQEIAVNGTALTEVRRNRVKAGGFFYSNASGVPQYPDTETPPYYHATTNFILRNSSGSTTISANAPADVSLRSYYITNGTTLYFVRLTRFNAAVTLKSADSMVGLPNISSTNRIYTLTDPNNGGASFDYSSTTQTSYTGTTFSGKTTLLADGVKIDGWPKLIADNVPQTSDCPLEAGSVCYTWMDASNVGGTLEDLFNLDLRRVWYPGAGDAAMNNVVDNTDGLRVNMRSSPGGDAYSAGDLLASVVVINPQSATQNLSIVPVYAGRSTFKIVSLDITDGTTMDFNLSWSGATFTDKATGETVHP